MDARRHATPSPAEVITSHSPRSTTMIKESPLSEEHGMIDFSTEAHPSTTSFAARLLGAASTPHLSPSPLQEVNFTLDPPSTPPATTTAAAAATAAAPTITTPTPALTPATHGSKPQRRKRGGVKQREKKLLKQQQQQQPPAAIREQVHFMRNQLSTLRLIWGLRRLNFEQALSRLDRTVDEIDHGISPERDVSKVKREVDVLEAVVCGLPGTADAKSFERVLEVLRGGSGAGAGTGRA